MGTYLELRGSLYASKPLKDISIETVKKVNKYFAKRVNISEFYYDDEPGGTGPDDYLYYRDYNFEHTNEDKSSLQWLLVSELCGGSSKIVSEDYDSVNSNLKIACKDYLYNFGANISNAEKRLALECGKEIKFEKALAVDPNSKEAKHWYNIGDNLGKLCLTPSDLVKVGKKLRELPNAESKCCSNYYNEALFDMFKALLNKEEFERVDFGASDFVLDKCSLSLLKKLDKRCSFEIDDVQFQLAFGIEIG